MKTCTTCRVPKADSEFYREGVGPGRSPRLKSSCKECHRARVRSASKTPEAHARERDRYHRTGAERQRAARASLRSRHFFVWRAQLWSRRWKVRVSAPELAGLWLRQRGRCSLSGRPLGRDAHLDHVVAVSNGGSHTIDNLRWLDAWVNVARQNLTDEEFLARCGEITAWSSDVTR